VGFELSNMSRRRFLRCALKVYPKIGRRISALEWTRRCARQEVITHGKGSF
jgi:hypothetical protein